MTGNHAKKQWTGILSSFSGSLLVVAASFLFIKSAAADTFTTETWKPIEIVLTSAKTYTNPYTDVDLSATFSGPNGITMTMPGFWDGGNTWRIRFAPTMAGAWTYTTISTPSLSFAGFESPPTTISYGPFTSGWVFDANSGVQANGSAFGASAAPEGSQTAFIQRNGIISQDYNFTSGSYTLSFKAAKRTTFGGTESFDVYYDSTLIGSYTPSSGSFASFTTSSFTATAGSHTIKFVGTTTGDNTDFIDDVTLNFTNSGLDNKTGSITVSNYSGALDIYKHGFVRPSDNNRYWSYADGTPFFALGDTQWMALSYRERLNSSNSPSFTSMFKGMADTRASQGYNFYNMNFFLSENGDVSPDTSGCNQGTYNEGGHPWGSGSCYDLSSRFKVLNVGFWQNADTRIQYLANAGITSSLGMDWGRSETNLNNEGAFKRAARYILARYGAYPMIFLTAGEVNTNANSIQPWTRTLFYFSSLDPYQRVRSMHQFVQDPGIGTTPLPHTTVDMNSVMLQGGHPLWGGVRGVWKYTSQWNGTPALPIMEMETYWENFTSQSTGHEARQAAWFAVIAGSAGYAYGAQGTWAATWDSSDTFQIYGDGVATPWYTALNFDVGKTQMGYMKAFFTSLDWSKTEPDANAIYWGSGAPTSGTQQPFQRSKTNRSLIVAYLPEQFNTFTGTANLNPAYNYTAQWYDPRNNIYTTIAENLRGPTWAIPNQPDTNDWVLLLKSTSTPAPNLALNKTYSSSSNFNSSQTANNAFDGDMKTNWQSASGTFANEWLQVDFGVSTTFNTVSISEYLGRTTGYRVEYWNGTSWNTAYTGTSLGAVSFTAVTGSKARIYFTSGSVQPVIYEFGVYNNLALGKTYSSSSNYNGTMTADKAFDGDMDSAWQSASGTFANEWLQVDFGANQTFNTVDIKEYNNRTTGYRIEYWNGSSWQTAYTGTAVGTVAFKPVTGSKARIYFTSGSAFQPIIYEFEAYYDTSNLARNKIYSSSTNYDATSTADKAFDGDSGTNWQSLSGTFANQWLQVDFAKSTTFNKVVISEYGGRISGYRIEYWDGTSWQTAYTGTTSGTKTFTAVTGTKARLFITSGSPYQPIVYEFEVYNQ